MGFAPSDRFTVYDVMSIARELSQTVEISKVLEKQGEYFYQLALNEIVTMLNSALDRSYLSSVEAVQMKENDMVANNPSALQLIVTADPIHNSATDAVTDNIIAINVLQKRVDVDGKIYDPLYQKKMDKLIAIEQRVEGIGALMTGKSTGVGQLKPVKLGELQSLMRMDFASGAYAEDLVYTEIGGNNILPYITCQTNGGDGKWTDRGQPGATYFPATGDGSVLFSSYYIRVRKDPNNLRITFTPDYESDVNYRRVFYTIWYQRLPNYPQKGSTGADDGWRGDSTHASRFVDLPDKFIPLLAKRIFTYCLMQLKEKIPDLLAVDTLKDYQQIAANVDADQRGNLNTLIENASRNMMQNRG